MKPLSEKTIEELRILHDKIKNHPFRKNPELYLLDEYYELYDKDLNNIIGKYTYDTYELSKEGVYLYYRSVKDRWLYYKDSSFPDGYFHFNDSAEIWSNPNIALINESVHDLRGIKWILSSNWNRPGCLSRFIETTEKNLTILHSLIEGIDITEMNYPKEYGEGYTNYKFIRNSLYDNDWTLEKYLHRVWYEDKGYID